MSGIYVASDADPRLTEWIGSLGIETVSVETEGLVSGPVSRHPDMFICRLGIGDAADIVVCPDLADYADLSGESSEETGASKAITGETHLKAGYPDEVRYNAACTGKYFIHNLKHTAPELLDAARSRGISLVDVRQGYAKCSIVIVDEESIITYDRGISKACRAAGLDVLEVAPGHVLLPGYDTGFIGGTSGRCGDFLVFNGNLSEHPDYGRIRDFVTGKGLRLKYFEEWPLTDIGSLV